MIKHITLSLLFCTFYLLSHAQLEGAIKLGMAGHQGDVHSISDDNIGLFSRLNTSFGAGLRLPISKVLRLRAEGAYFSLSGDERDYASIGHRRRGYSFENKFIEASALLEYELTRAKRLKELDKPPSIVTPVFFAGLGVMFGDPEVDFRSGTPTNADIDLENGSQPQLTLPVGFGLRYALSKKFSLGFEVAFRLPVSDYYDGISLTANPDLNDIFAFGGVAAYYKFREEPDTDQDGVVDKEDDCPETPGPERLKGCPDSDLDGVIDINDNCPLEVGSLELGGCPDDDKDGIINRLDGCPEVAGELKNRGCPDTDEDGVVDADDNCPEISGLVELNGCPDTDEDGVADNEDKCPKIAGSVENNGCPVVDTDKDGIADNLDKCPDVAGTSDNDGCPAIATTNSTTVDSTAISTTTQKPADPTVATTQTPSTTQGESSTTTVITTDSPATKNTDTTTGLMMDVADIQKKLNLVAADITFNTASSDLSTTAKSALNDAIAIMQANPSLQLSINGYTDNVGSAVSNQRLSERRAKSAYDYVLSQGIEAERLSYRGLGENAPIANNNTAAGRYQNRRVELILTDNSGNSLAPTSGTNLNVVSYGSTTKSCSGHPIFNL
ncbi:MAG: DUF6089 family protein, partial [Saprospiraceae bacterium]